MGVYWLSADMDIITVCDSCNSQFLLWKKKYSQVYKKCGRILNKKSEKIHRVHRRQLAFPGGSLGWTWTLLDLTGRTRKDPLASPGNSAQCHVGARMGGEFGGQWIHVYGWLSPFAVRLKLSQHC